MKKIKLIPGMLFLAGAISLSSCGEDVAGGGNATGSIAPVVDVDAIILGADVESRAANDAAPDVNDLDFTVTSADGSYNKTWRLGDFSAEEKFPIGEYKVEVSYADPQAEGFDATPAYYDTQTVKVVEQQTTPVSLSASRTHAEIEVRYTDVFKKYIKSATVGVTGTSKKMHVFDFPDDRTALIVPGETVLSLSYQKQNGKGETNQQIVKFEAKPKTHYVITLNVNDGEIGGAKFEVIFDDTVKNEDIDVSLSDGEFFPAPEFTDDCIADGTEISFVETTFNDAVKIGMIASAGLQQVTLNVNSTALNSNMEIDLIADDVKRNDLKDKGLKVYGLEGTIGTMAVLDFTDLIKNLPYTPSNPVSEFTVTVVDKKNQRSEPISFKVNVQELILQLENITVPFNVMDGDLVVDLDYNGDVDKLEMVYLNRSGVHETISKDHYKLESNGENKYLLTISGMPEDEKAVNLTVSCGNISRAKKFERHGAVLSVDDRNVFATHAYVSLVPASGSPDIDFSNVEFVNLDDNNAAIVGAKEGDYYKLTGLKPNTTYTVSIKDPVCTSVTFTTEADTQLPNSNLDGAVTTSGSESNWENIVFPDGWGTNNAMTTSQGGNFAYCRISGTIQTDDAHSGKAALIRTVGWGSGNSASGSVSTGTMKYSDTGLLHLGKTRNNRPSDYSERIGPLTTGDLDCGVEFVSRPSKLSFWYKYSPKNSADKGYAEIRVIDSAGKDLYQGQLSLDACDNYTQKYIDLEKFLRPGLNKASKIYVKFLSTNDERFLAKESSNFNPPPFGGNFGKGTYIGSQLYIDDIKLIYE